MSIRIAFRGPQPYNWLNSSLKVSLKLDPISRMFTYIVVLIATLPLATKYLINQLNDENYQFCLPYLACLVWIGWHRLSIESFRSFRPLPSDIVLMLATWVVSAISIALNYPKGGYLAFQLGSLLGIKLLFDASGFVKVIPIFIASLLVLSPPFGILELITTQLQGMVVQVAHNVLLSANVLHRISGNIILLGDRPLLVAEACSGIRSLVSIISLSICFCLYRNHSWVRSAGLFSISILVVIILNLFRILFIVFMIHEYRLDFTLGLKHTLLGLFIFLGGLLVILGTDNLLDNFREFLAKRQDSPKRSDSEPELNFEEEPETELLTSIKPNRIWPNLSHLGIALLVLFIPCALLQGRIMVREGTSFLINTNDFGHLPLLDKKTFPNLDGWKLIKGPEIVEDQKLLGQGIQSQFWIFEKGGLVARMAIDEPFHGFHDLAFCYRNVGWDQKDQKDNRSQDGKFQMEVNYFRPPNQRLFLLFGHIDPSGNWLLPNTLLGNYMDAIRNRISETLIKATPTDGSRINFQLQMSCVTGHDLSTAERNDLKELFELIRNEVQKWPELGKKSN